MSTITDRPTWHEGWTDESVTPVTDSKPRQPRALIAAIAALASALVLTMALAIVSTSSLEDSLDSARTELTDAESTISDLEQDVIDITAQADLADEASGQEAWRADQCHIAADAATSLAMAGYAALDGDMAAFDEWMADTQRALSGSGYSNVLEAWNACNDLV